MVSVDPAINSLFSGKLSNKVSIEILEAKTFSGATEFAVKVAGEVVSVCCVKSTRDGGVLVKTTSKITRIKTNDPEKGKEDAAAPLKPTLSDV